MAAALIVENGSNVAGANSFATLDQIRGFNEMRGLVLPDDDAAVIALAAQAMDYLASQEYLLAGARTFGAGQPLSWPRKDVRAYGSVIAVNVIPYDIISVQCYVAGIAGDIDLYGNKDSSTVIEDTIGPLTTKFAPGKGATAGPILPTVTAMLRPYFKTGVGTLKSVRV